MRTYVSRSATNLCFSLSNSRAVVSLPHSSAVGLVRTDMRVETKTTATFGVWVDYFKRPPGRSYALKMRLRSVLHQHGTGGFANRSRINKTMFGDSLRDVAQSVSGREVVLFIEVVLYAYNEKFVLVVIV